VKRKTGLFVFVPSGIIVTLLLLFRLCCGIFILPPIGAVTEGATVIYWRTNLNLPFVSSLDSLADTDGEGVSVIRRLVVIATVGALVGDRKIARLDYSHYLYLYSTNGKTYQRSK
jgi:hypothetical protein